jgi:NTE family protein
VRVRAAVFHLGVLKRMAGEDLLEQVSTISTVSGGSLIMPALLTSLCVVIFAAVC